MWHSPEELVTIGFGASSVLMVNEGHNGLSRCARTRVIGLRMVEAAHELGCRALAMEALPNLGAGPSEHTARPEPFGYLAQPEMIDLIDAALARRWTLIGYEAPLGSEFEPESVRADRLSIEATNWREGQQTDNLAAAVRYLDGASLMVWVGNGHHCTSPVGDWTPMGHLLTANHGIDPYCIDQLATVALAPGHQPDIPLTPELTRTLDERGGTAGFTADDPPPGLPVIPGYHAFILSTDNTMVGEPPEAP